MNLLTQTDNIDFSPFDKTELIPCVVQSDIDGQVLMLAYLSRDAYAKTLESKTLTFFSRSRQQLWVKGETSGNRLSLKSLTFDCDQDTLLALVSPVGPTCHLGTNTCFGSEPLYRKETGYEVLKELYETILSRKTEAAEKSYTKYLFDSGLDKILKKIGEEASEVIIASKNAETDPLLNEVADLMYHLYVLLAEKNIAPEAFLDILAARAKS